MIMEPSPTLQKQLSESRAIESSEHMSEKAHSIDQASANYNGDTLDSLKQKLVE